MKEKVIIPNRGVVALDIIDSLKSIGLETILLHSPDDSMSLPVKLADKSFKFFSSRLEDSYMDRTAIIEKALELNPGYEYTYSNIGYIYYLQKKYQQSINVYKKLVEIVPDNVNALYFIGVNYMLLKNFDSAVYPLKKAVELEPNNANALYNLAIAYLNLHDNYSAREIYNKLKTIDPRLAKKLEEHLR